MWSFQGDKQYATIYQCIFSIYQTNLLKWDKKQPQFTIVFLNLYRFGRIHNILFTFLVTIWCVIGLQWYLYCWECLLVFRLFPFDISKSLSFIIIILQLNLVYFFNFSYLSNIRLGIPELYCHRLASHLLYSLLPLKFKVLVDIVIWRILLLHSRGWKIHSIVFHQCFENGLKLNRISLWADHIILGNNTNKSSSLFIFIFVSYQNN